MINHNVWYRTNQDGYVIPLNYAQFSWQSEQYQPINLDDIELLYKDRTHEDGLWVTISQALYIFQCQGQTTDNKVNLLHAYVDKDGQLFIHYLLDSTIMNTYQQWIISSSTPYKLQVGKDGWRLKDYEHDHPYE